MQPANSSFVSNATAAAPAQPSLADILLNDLSFTATLQFKRGETIFLNNQQENNIFIIKEGRVKLSNHSDDGREIIKAILISNEIFGESAIYNSQMRNETAQALEQTQLYVISVQDIRDRIASDASFANLLMNWLGSKIQKTQQRLEMLVFKNARNRVLQFIVDIAHDYGRAIGYEILISQFYTHKEIAQLTDTSRQTATTILNEMRKSNLVYFNRHRLLIRNIQKLESMALQ